MNPSNSSPVQNQTKSLPHHHKQILPITDSGTYTQYIQTLLKSTPFYKSKSKLLNPYSQQNTQSLN